MIHGCPSNAEKAMNPETRTYDKHWMPWLKRELATRGINTVAPLMPNPWEPNYETFRAEFEKNTVTEEDVLIGHRCGTTFLIRWLGDTKQKVEKLVLVAPWKIADKDDVAQKIYYETPIDESIKERVKEIIIFTANDDYEDGRKSVKIIHDALGGKVIELIGRGHYTRGDMGTEEFPELLEEVTK